MKKSKSLFIGDLSFKYVRHNSPVLGLAVSKYYGGSVERNLFKRRCRSLFRNKIVSKGLNVAVVVRPCKQNISFSYMESAFENLYETIYH